LQFSDRQLQISDKIMGAQNFNAAPKFLQNEIFLAPVFSTFGVKFSEKKIFRQVKIYEGNCPPLRPATTPLLTTENLHLPRSSSSGSYGYSFMTFAFHNVV